MISKPGMCGERGRKEGKLWVGNQRAFEVRAILTTICISRENSKERGLAGV